MACKSVSWNARLRSGLSNVGRGRPRAMSSGSTLRLVKSALKNREIGNDKKAPHLFQCGASPVNELTYRTLIE